ncbi:PQQ-like beta-propeller repeat protein [Mycobacterium sp. MYCO198283]|uniref:outer membrane protein assembly factor BamB family protein n=1 Tax=Mycobacterium sp. MYCO198283 TaxID=2883505 RepID=UPI001E2BF093|nr:PQQ-binding-like beta-propeller repeat protein [Mycobacterium sp. MYCO198283]MCG5432231.1 PQQ-like beta-propeller repeat protein [Mycobacterium sp. MYCO198283]
MRLRRDLPCTAGKAVRAASALLGALAAGLLGYALGLAVWSRTGARRAVTDGTWDRETVALHPFGRELPQTLTTTAVVFAVMLLIGLAVSATGWRGASAARWLLVAGAVLAVGDVATNSRGLPAFYRAVMDEYPVGPALPAALAAWALTGMGALAALIAAPLLPPVRRPGRIAGTLAIVGLVFGLAAGVTLNVAVVRAGDENRYIESTTAAEVEIPPLPAALGASAFTMKVVDGPDRSETPEWMIKPAGAGFVVLQRGTVTAYAADGTSRWTYRRTGPRTAPVSTMRVYGAGRVVVIGTVYEVTGLDAVTGEHLWTIGRDPADPFSSREFTTSGSDADPRFPVVTRDEGRRWEGFDPWTGQRMWSVDTPHRQCRPATADTPARIVGTFTCPDGSVRLVSADPGSGRVDWDTTLFASVPPVPDARITVSPVGPAVAVSVASDSRISQTVVADVDKRTVTAIQPPGWAVPTRNSTGGYLVAYPTPRLQFRDADGRVRCELPTDIATGVRRGDYSSHGVDDDYVALPEQLLVRVRAEESGRTRDIRLLDGTDCARISALPDGADAIGLLPVPGALLVIRADRTGTYIDGYR